MPHPSSRATDDYRRAGHRQLRRSCQSPARRPAATGEPLGGRCSNRTSSRERRPVLWRAGPV